MLNLMLISAIFSLTIGTLVLIFIIKTLYSAWFSKKQNSGSGKSLFSINRLFSFGVTKLIKRKEEHLNLAKIEYHNNNFDKSKKNLIQSFFFNKYSFFITPKTLHSQHLQILEALLEFKQSNNIQHLEIIETKIDELTKIHNQFLIESKNKSKFKKSPEWASKEHAKKIKSIKENLENTELEIINEVEEFYSKLNTSSKTNVTYH